MIRLNGSGHGQGGGVNGRHLKNGMAEPSKEEILTFLRGTLAADAGIGEAAITLPEGDLEVPVAIAASSEPQPAAAQTTAPGGTSASPASVPAQAPGGVPTPLTPVAIPFKDTRFSRLGAAARPPELIAEATVVTPAPQPEALPQHNPSEALSSLGSARNSSPPGVTGNAWPFAPAVRRPAAAPHWTAAAMSQAAPPDIGPALVPPPLPPAGAPGIDTVESASAELLRPVLRQWLSENMPRIVEKALRIELTGGAAMPPAEPKKD